MMRRSEIEIEKRVIVEGAVMTVTAEGAVWTVMVMTVIVEKTAASATVILIPEQF
jgi:hypothetical protein